MKRLFLAPAIVLPFFLVSCGQPGGPGGAEWERPMPPSDGSAATMERSQTSSNQTVGTETEPAAQGAAENRIGTDGASSKVSGPSSYRPERTQQRQREQRQVDTATSAS